VLQPFDCRNPFFCVHPFLLLCLLSLQSSCSCYNWRSTISRFHSTAKTPPPHPPPPFLWGMGVPHRVSVPLLQHFSPRSFPDFPFFLATKTWKLATNLAWRPISFSRNAFWNQALFLCGLNFSLSSPPSHLTCRPPSVRLTFPLEHSSLPFFFFFPETLPQKILDVLFFFFSSFLISGGCTWGFGRY